MVRYAAARGIAGGGQRPRGMTVTGTASRLLAHGWAMQYNVRLCVCARHGGPVRYLCR